ncbi:hypothetical protein IV203_027588 [Nitzschia inconspicua]|uniref:Uncharacterized protein n=1 Tax=Nitzschia inconspicua TaxID=303405 RepID=A0A9K3LWY8_9STRA|nr:hypothetical protein IV203_027588 [Nitzschia inconspicua]
MTLPNPLILLLRTSCTDSKDANTSTKETETASLSSSIDEYASLMALLAKQPIQCDVMLLPEIHNSSDRPFENQSSPSSSSTSSFFQSALSSSSMTEDLHLPKTSMNPCGTSNVMIVETLPWNNLQQEEGGGTAKLGSVLVSLTSCSVIYQVSPSSEASTSYHLPIEPVPSTFVLNFDALSQVEGSEQHRLAELSVEFNYGKATSVVEDLIRDQVDSSRAQKDGNPMENVENILDMSEAPSMEPSTCMFEREGKTYSTTVEGGATSPPFHPQQQLLSSIKDYEAQKILLRQLRVQMEQDARLLDMILRALGCVGIFLFCVLLWAIFQFYRSKAKSDEQSNDIQESMKETRRVLQNAIDGLQPLNLKRHSDQADTSFKTPDMPSHIAADSTKSIDSICGISLPDIRVSMATLSSQEHEPSLTTEHGESMLSARSASPLFDHGALDDVKNAIRTPEWKHARGSRLEDPPIDPQHSNSPYTLGKFEREWMEKSTIRRSNRKKKKAYLRPISLPSDKAREQNKQQLVGPPQLLSVVRDGNNCGNSVFRSESSSTDGSAGDLDHSNGRIPNLCSTPASEDLELPDDHFINDYWW